ncbi:MAG: Glycosyl transferase group 1 [Candidatus Woesebacteria bacterium GW2011_GWB1_45_5]|uniref:Glycosyl transferase group 1 n=1 Tax=Candidatus Woesebacteria bacterium GW2011_GWB1_45_5 TaxID=1618581 RepID=A0A0G1MQY8_9BACT|nr:MAG: Glycosyl transferase group 1 [Candidatus Woesebacteria bacterium GW2011_GWB1_45_5]
MIIGIDGNEANISERVGVNEYPFQILQNLAKLQEKGECGHSLIVYLKEKPLPDLPKETQNFKYKIIPGGGLWIITKLMPDLFLGKPKPDIFFSPSHYVPVFAPMPRACSIMDLGYLKFSGQFRKKDFWQLKIWSAISILLSKRIFAISNSTKEDIVRHYSFARDKISVTHLGYDPGRFNINISEKDVRRIKKTYSIVDDYVLYLGTLKPSKNIETLIEAFGQLTPRYPKIRLIIAGKKGWMYKSIYKKVEKSGLTAKVTFTDFVPEEDKPALIKGARVFVLPSYWEGFGLDAVNAMATGVPVVASNAGSLPEVIGEAGVVVDPKNADSMAAGIESVLSADSIAYNEMAKRGLMQSNKFSWEKCARETLRILESGRIK